MLTKVSALIIMLVLASFPTSQAQRPLMTASPPSQDVEYISSDLKNSAVFTPQSVRFGPFWARSEAAWPASPAKYLPAQDGIMCISFGRPGSTVEYAIKRPISLGDSYKCLESSFRVKHCYFNCRAAIIQVNTPVGTQRKRGVLRSYLYVDTCRGVIAISQVSDLSRGFPPDIPWLRGDVGILADTDYPDCKFGGRARPR